jgi:hypothetical protein
MSASRGQADVIGEAVGGLLLAMNGSRDVQKCGDSTHGKGGALVRPLGPVEPDYLDALARCKFGNFM